MRILVLGAGGTGGYFGGLLAQSGADVTFLVRPKRAETLARTGLVIRGPDGVRTIAVRTLTADCLDGAYDLVLLSCKAYDLDSAIAAITPAMGPHSAVLPVLNGLSHYASLDAAFGAERVLGGLCHIAATLGPQGEVIRSSAIHRLTFGERAGGTSARVEALAALCVKADFDTVLSRDVAQAQWEKFVFIASLAAATCLMRASVGTIIAAGGAAVLSGLYAECAVTAAAADHAPGEAARNEATALLGDAASGLTASMLRDLEAGHRTEGDHILGDMLRRGQAAGVAAPLLGLAHTHVQAYEIRRQA